MSAKCGATHTDTLWRYGETWTCTRNKGHNGDHTMPELIKAGRQQWWRSNNWYNSERYCGKSIAGGNSYRCERRPGHKTPWHKCWVLRKYIAWKDL